MEFIDIDSIYKKIWHITYNSNTTVKSILLT